MPYISEKMRVGRKYDRRIKLSLKQKEEIKILQKQGFSQRALARKFKVSRRLIIFIIYPERLAKSRANRNWRNYYSKKYNNQKQKEHRRYKQKLYKKGLIK